MLNNNYSFIIRIRIFPSQLNMMYASADSDKSKELYFDISNVEIIVRIENEQLKFSLQKG